jgi:hypothetical protein
LQVSFFLAYAQFAQGMLPLLRLLHSPVLDKVGQEVAVHGWAVIEFLETQ